MDKYDFGGWATRNDLLCSDGRTIRKDAFKHNDGKTVPLVWNHRSDEPGNVLGKAILCNKPEGVYTYGIFNNTEDGQKAKELVMHGDISSLSIHANRLKQKGSDVMYGDIKEVSLVLAGANPGACIDSVIRHGEESEDEAIIYTGERYHIALDLSHSDEEKEEKEEKTIEEIFNTLTDEQKDAVYAIVGAASGGDDEDDDNNDGDSEDGEDNDTGDEGESGEGGEVSHAEGSEKTVEDVFNTLNEEQKNVVYALIAQALDEKNNNSEETEGGNKNMKHNAFDSETDQTNTLTHADQEAIVELARQTGVGSFRAALDIYAEENESIKHGFTEQDLNDVIFPEYKDLKPGAPDMLTTDQGWIAKVLTKVHKSPFSRIRTRQADVRNRTNLRGRGYKKGTKKTDNGDIAMIHRTTDPQTVYVKSALNRDDIIDITDFDVVAYMYQIDRMTLNEELATAFLIGDGRAVDDPDRINPEHIRPIYGDSDTYVIYSDVDVEAAKSEIQGSDTSKHFSDNYVYAEAVIRALLYAREQYKGSGNPDFFCDPHLVNVMLLARDFNGRRIYDTVADLKAALNVNEIITVEQLAGVTRVSGTGVNAKTKKLLGLMGNLADYTVGATKGGEITHFTDFDIDFNQKKSLLETRISGALTKPYCFIALEEEVNF